MARCRHLSLLVLAALVLAAVAGAARGRTIETTQWHVRAVGLEDARLFWVLDRCTEVFSRPLAGGRRVHLGNARFTECDYDDELQVAFARGGRALWIAEGSGNETYAYVLTAAPGERPKLLDEAVGSSAGGDGDYLTAVAGGDGTLVYAVVRASMLDTCIDPGTPCDHSISSSRVMRVVGRRKVRVPGVPPALRLAAGGGRIAVDVAGDHDGQRFVRAGRVEVRDAATGRLSATVRPGGNVLELALSGDVLAVLVRSGGRKTIERYAPRGGRLLGRTRVYGNAHALAVSGQRVVFATGRAVRQLGAGRVGIVAVAPRPVVAVAVEGRSVVWAEHDGRRSRIVLAQV